MFKTQHHVSGWTDRVHWEWPDYDRKLIQVFDWVEDCQAAIDLCDKRGLAIQAGGAVGVWPAYLSQHFDKVVTLEPEPINYACLVENVKDLGNVTTINGAFSDSNGFVSLENDPRESNNCGTWYIHGAGSIMAYAGDSLDLAVDFLCLDVEGHELEALHGFEKTIERYRPVIMLEEKPLPHMKRPASAAREWLGKFGYTIAARVNRDIILSC